MREFINRKTISTLGIFWLGAVLSAYLPDAPIDPWGVLAPRRALTIFMVLVGIQWFSAFVKYFFGHVHGAFLSGFFVGLISSTAIHMVATKSTSHEDIRSVRCVSATLASVALMSVIILIADASLFYSILAPWLGSVLVLIFFLVYLGRERLSQLAKSPALAKGIEPPLVPPKLLDSLRFALIFFGILLLIGWLKSILGPESVLYLAFLTSLFELHSFVTSACSLHLNQQISHTVAIQSLVIALSTSILAKGLLLLAFTRARWALLVFMTYLASASIAFVIYILLAI
jgi:uncharacterized membrane protein (DUF4010 family)